MSEDLARNDQEELLDELRRLLESGQAVEALERLLVAKRKAPIPDVVSDQLLSRPRRTLAAVGRPCLLLLAARHDTHSDHHEFADWLKRDSPCQYSWKKLFSNLFKAGSTLHQPLAILRFDLAALAHSADETEQLSESLQRITRGYAAAWKLPNGTSWLDTTGSGAMASHPPTWLVQLCQNRKELTPWQLALQHCAEKIPGGWSHPAMHFVAQSFFYLLGHDLPQATGIASTRILAVDRAADDGLIGHLVIESIPNGTGILVPHPFYAAYLPADEQFQLSLLHAMQAVRMDLPEPQCDYRWSVWFDQSRLMPSLSGDSAGAAFYCAMRAATTGELLDDQAIITAALTKSSLLSKVGGLDLKIIATRDGTHLRKRLVRRILVSSTQEWEGQPLDKSSRSIKVGDWPLALEPAADRKKAYASLTEYSRVAKAIKQHLAAQADELLEGEHGLCKPYIRPRFEEVLPRHWNDISRPREPESMSSSGAEPPGRVLSPDENFALLAGKGLAAKEPVLVLADSGMGKSSFLLAAEREIARQDNTRVPVRLGAGPKSTRINEDGRPIPKAPLSDLLGTRRKPNKRIRSAVYRELQDSLPLDQHKSLETWFTEATKRGDLVFLLDALDQTADDIPLPSFFQKFPNCPSIVTGRPEIKQSRKESQNQIDWREHRLRHLSLKRTKDDQGNSNRDSDIDEYCRSVPGLADLLVGNEEWHDLIQIPVLLDQMRKLHVRNPLLLVGLTNREAVYDATLKMLLTQGVNAPGRPLPEPLVGLSAEEIRRMLAEYAFEMWTLADDRREEFTGSVRGQALDQLNRRFPGVTVILNRLNATSFGAYFDQGQTTQVIAWRHLSFGEWFAGLHLANLDEKEQREFFEKHARTPNRGWVTAFAMAAADRMQQPEVVERMSRWLIEYGNPFRLHLTVKADKLTISDRLMGLCNWLVHRDRDFMEVESGRPVVDLDIARILETMFSLDAQHCPKYRDSRWLDAAWELICHTIGAQGEETTPEANATDVRTSKQSPDAKKICESIHNQFLAEFETRLNQYRGLRMGSDRKNWLIDNRGLVQLVPEECLESLNLPAPNLAPIRLWPKKSSNLLSANTDYRIRRDLFNQRLAVQHVNWCLCPPKNWKHPYGRLPHEGLIGVNGLGRVPQQKRLIPHDYFLQRVPMTNQQFKAFDPGHKSFRQLQWKPDGEPDETALKNHPVVEVSWFQARMMAIWMTGKNRAFGQFELPEEKDWEACCRAGRDGDRDISGVPWIDDNGQEHFDVMTSQQAKCDGRRPWPSDRPELEGRSIDGTVPVGQYRANGFGLVDMQGQVWEWQRDVWGSSASPAGFTENARSVRRVVRGGSWSRGAWNSCSSDRSGYEAGNRCSDIGFRLTRTRSN